MRSAKASSSLLEWPLWKQYALSICGVAGAIGARWLLDPVLDDKLPFVTLFMVLLPLVLLVRPGPFLVASVLGCAGVRFLFISPRFIWRIDGPVVDVQIGLFAAAALIATITAWLSGRAQDRARQAAASLRESEVRLAAALAERTEEVTRAEKSLATSERLAAVGTMAASLAHDINNILLPLSSITDRMLEAPRIQGETRESLVVLVALIDHLRALSKNLLLFAQDPEREGTSGTTDLASWSRQVKGLMEIALMNDSGRGDNGTPGIRLDWSIPSSVPAVGVAPHRLTQAMLNILHNARDAILAARDQRGGQSDFGHIQVLARPLAEQFVEVAIIDNGCGMDSDTTRRSTEPFFTTKDGRSTPGTSGNGFGLAMVHAICERVHGRLDIESRLGEGTTVTLTLPVAHPSRMNR